MLILIVPMTKWHGYKFSFGKTYWKSIMQTHKPKATNLLHLFLHNTFTTTNFKYNNKEIFDSAEL